MYRTEQKDTTFRGDIGVPINLEVKELSEDGEFEGYAAVFNNKDQGNDVILPGAFTQTLRSQKPEKVKMLLQHDSRVIIGKWLEFSEDNRGLKARGKIIESVRQGEETLTLMREGVLEGLSMGYISKEWEYDRDKQVRMLKRVDLLEVSVVTFPMNRQANILRVKSDGTLPTEREFEQFLMRDAGFTAQQAKSIVAHGYKSITDERDAGREQDTTELMESISRLRSLIHG